MYIKNEIPKIYDGATMADVPKTVAKLVEEMAENVRMKKGLYLWGTPGVGKTHVAWAIARHLSALKWPVWLVKSSEIVEAIKFTFGGITEHSREFYDFLEELKSFKGVLIIDDIGAEKYPEGVVVQYFSIIDKRYENILPMCFTSNVNLPDLTERLSERIVSRIYETCNAVELTGKNRRV